MKPAPFFAEVADAPEGTTASWLTTADGLRIRVATQDGGALGTAVIFPGRTEYIEKYGRVMRRLAGLGLSVAVIDWRGQGLSHRYPKAPRLGHVPDFRDYQRDVAAALSCDAVRALPRPWHLIGHSMGGCIGLRSLLERADFQSAIFSAPMWHLQMRGATRELATRLSQIASLVGLGTRLMPGSGARPSPLDVAFENNALTSDREHFAWAQRQIAQHPDLAIGGPSMQWTRAALEEMARLYIAPLPNLPVLGLLGSAETVVSATVIRKQIAAMAKGDLVICEGARHEIFMETQPIQDFAWQHIAAFLTQTP